MPTVSNALAPDAALDSFARGCAAVRTGVLLEAIGYAILIAYIAAQRFVPDVFVGLLSSMGKSAPIFVLLPVLPLAVGNLFTAIGRGQHVSAARADGVGPVMVLAVALAWVRFVCSAVTAMSFVGLQMALDAEVPKNAPQRLSAEDVHLVRGLGALVVGYLLGLLLESTALTALATVAAVRGLGDVNRRVTGAALAFQILIVVGVASFVANLFSAYEAVQAPPPPRDRFAQSAVPVTTLVIFAVQTAALFWYASRQYVLHATGARIADRVKANGWW